MKYSNLKSNEIDNKQKIYGKNLIKSTFNYLLFFECIFYCLLILIIINILYSNILHSVILFFLFLNLLLLNFFVKRYIKKNKNDLYCTVIRDDKKIKIKCEDVVCGDLIEFGKNDNVCADSIILESHNLVVDESFFDYNRLNIYKKSFYEHSNSNLKSNCLYTGSKIVDGYALCKVFGIGYNTEYAKKINYINSKFSNKFKNNYINYIYLFYNILIFILFLLSIVINNVTLLSLSIVFSTFCYHYLLKFYFIKVLNTLRFNKFMIINEKNLFDIYKSRNIFIDNTLLNNNKIEILEINSFNNTEKKCLLKNLYISTSNEKIKKALNVDNNLDLMNEFKYNSLDFKIYKNFGKYEIFVSGGAESIFDLCSLDLETKFKINKLRKENLNKGIKTICVGHAITENLKTNSYDYQINFDGFITYKNYIDDNITNKINIIKNKLNTYFFIDDTKKIINKTFDKFSNIDNSYVINRKELYKIDNKYLYDDLKEIYLYSKLKPEDINYMGKFFKNTIIFNDNSKYYMENYDLSCFINAYNRILFYFKFIKGYIFVNILILILLIFMSFVLNYIIILIIKFIILIISYFIFIKYN